MNSDPFVSAPMVVAPRIACGHWYGDRWMGRYLRGRFEVAAGRWRLMLRVYVPATEPAPIRMLVRQGPDRVLHEIEATAGVVTENALVIEVGDTGQLDILLRTDRCCARAAGDSRMLGVVLVAFELSAVT